MTPGYLISFEGIDGAGKTTQINSLHSELVSRGYRTVTLREPGGTDISEKIRALLLDARNRIDPVAEALLYAAARAQLVHEMVKPLLAQGTIILADRFIDSTIAYQGYGRGLNIEDLSRLNDIATGGLEPDLTILLDISEVVANERRRGLLPDRLEKEGLEFQRRVRQGYLKLSREKPRFAVVDGSLPPNELSSIITGVVTNFLKGDF